jgi:hypothetical protein
MTRATVCVDGGEQGCRCGTEQRSSRMTSDMRKGTLGLRISRI